MAERMRVTSLIDCCPPRVDCSVVLPGAVVGDNPPPAGERDQAGRLTIPRFWERAEDLGWPGSEDGPGPPSEPQTAPREAIARSGSGHAHGLLRPLRRGG